MVTKATNAVIDLGVIPLSADLNTGGNEVIGLPATPSGATASASKQYVDDEIAGVGGGLVPTPAGAADANKTLVVDVAGTAYELRDDPNLLVQNVVGAGPGIDVISFGGLLDVSVTNGYRIVGSFLVPVPTIGAEIRLQFDGFTVGHAVNRHIVDGVGTVTTANGADLPIVDNLDGNDAATVTIDVYGTPSDFVGGTYRPSATSVVMVRKAGGTVERWTSSISFVSATGGNFIDLREPAVLPVFGTNAIFTLFRGGS